MKPMPVTRAWSCLTVAALLTTVGACGTVQPSDSGATTPATTRPATTTPATPATHTPTPTPVAPTPTDLPTRMEQEGYRGANTFTDPHHPGTSRRGPRVQPMTFAPVICRVLAQETLTANPDGYWYLLGGTWHGKYWAVANTFWNGDVPGHKPYTHNTDKSVPLCRSSS
ncbi:hypothetical protein OHB00_02535 [Streptomyces sp. NBC_00631]|uniref:hypothetical protein n=1 Tax=Streptomyces sp. NBC_00631 TaxID=2975793 RepID=UPI0030E308D9